MSFLATRKAAPRVRGIADAAPAVDAYALRLEETERALVTMEEVLQRTAYPSPAALQLYLQQDAQVYAAESYVSRPFETAEKREALLAALDTARTQLGDPPLGTRPTMRVQLQRLYDVYVHLAVFRLTALERRRELTFGRLELVYVVLNRDAMRALRRAENDLADWYAPRASEIGAAAAAVAAIGVLDAVVPPALDATTPAPEVKREPPALTEREDVGK